MATSSFPRRNEEDKRVTPHHHERNKTFSSTTTNHYKNKLAQIGIQKDLREILERKKLEKEYEQNNLTPNTNESNKTLQASRKVRFVEDKIPIRRSHSFTSGTSKNSYPKNYNGNFVENIEIVRETTPPKKFNQSFKGRRKDFVDLQNPTNIKIELQTDSGQRKYMLDENVPLATVKCNMRNCRNILNHPEIKEKSVAPSEQIRVKPRQATNRNVDRNKSINKKTRVPVAESQKNNFNEGE